MDRIGSILSEVINNKRFGKKLLELSVLAEYEKIVGDKIASISRPSFIKNEVLFIGVQSPVWSQQLHFFKNDILEKVNNHFGRPVIKDIKFHISPFEDNKVKAIFKISDKKTVVPDKKLKLVYNISSEIKDTDLRRKFEELMMKDLIYKINKGEQRCSST